MRSTPGTRTAGYIPFEKTCAQLLRARDTSSKVFEKSSRTYARSGIFKDFFLV